jgi:hypothetical protein
MQRGAQFTISRELISEIILERLGLDPKVVAIHSMTTEHHHDSVRISIIGQDDRLPFLKEGQEIPRVTVIARESNRRLIDVEFLKD